MFKWMITGHKSHKQKSSKISNNNNRNSLNNARNTQNENGSFCNGLKNDESCKIMQYSENEDQVKDRVDTQHQGQEQQQTAVLHPQQISFRNSRNSLIAASRDTLNDSNEYTTLETLQLQRNGNTQDTNLKKLTGVKVDYPPPLPHPRSSVPSGVGSQPNLHCLPHPEFPLYPNSQGHGLGSTLQAPGTCTLPRRSIVREDARDRFRSPSNPPPSSRQPPPYSRHQPPEPFNRIRRPCQPPPPPRVPDDFNQNVQQQQQFMNQQQRVQQQPQQQQQRNSYFGNVQSEEHNSSDLWNAATLSWAYKDASTGPQNLNQQSVLSGPRSFDTSIQPYPSINTNNSLPDQSSFPSKSTEDLLNASRVPADGPNSSKNGNSYLPGSSFTQNGPEILSSDSVYPNQNLSSSVKFENLNESTKRNLALQGKEYIVGVSTNPRDCRRVPVMQHSPELTTFKPSKENYQRNNDNSKSLITIDKRNSHNIPENQNGNIQRDASSTNSKAMTRTLLGNQDYVNEEELFISEDGDSREPFDGIQNNSLQDKKQLSIEVNSDFETSPKSQNYSNGVEALTVRDFQTFPDKRPTVPTVMDGRGNSHVDMEREEGRRGDGCTTVSSAAPSSSWMEWTQQLQAYVAWVNSQLRKMPNKQLITDLRRDFQNGVVFADLIEIIAGEKVAGITRDAETPQLRKENLERVLQFMAAKRIRMTHITSKEITEGNLKSIMRVILALAAHYKPQSVREGNAAASTQQKNSETQTSERQQNTNISSQQNQTKRTVTKAVMHDIGVGPDAPLTEADKTPSLIRRNITIIDGNEETSCIPLRRQPSLTNSVRPTSPSAPVYENLPKRSSQNRWAYDSLRASHKFYWGSASESKPQLQKDSRSPSKQYALDDVSEDYLSTSFNTSSRCTSLNTSLECETEAARESSSSLPFNSKNPPNKPAALEFWQDMQSSDRPNNSSKDSPEEVDSENPFKYHTIHRISGRRKLPQIPGQSSPSSTNSRGNTPNGSNPSGPSSDISQTTLDGDTRGNTSSLTNRSGSNSDDTSREPEGRSQNSSPATSLVRGPVIDTWRELVGLEKLEKSIDDLKDHYRDQVKENGPNNAREKSSLGLRSMLRAKDGGVEYSNRGVNTFEEYLVSPEIHRDFLTPDLGIHRDYLTPELGVRDILTSDVGLHKDFMRHLGLTNKNNTRLTQGLREQALDYFSVSYENNQNIEFNQTTNEHKDMKTSKKWRLSSRFKFKDCGSEAHGKANDVTAEGSASSLRQEVLKHIIARRTLENEKAELTRHIAQRDNLICDLRKQLIQKEKALHHQRNQFEEAIRNIQNGQPYRPFRNESPIGRNQSREEIQLVREAISALRGNFRGTDPNQHTLDTLEQAIAVLMERNSTSNGEIVNTHNSKKEKRSINAPPDSITKIIYFTDRTVTPFMSCINKRLCDVTLRDFKNLFDRSGNFRFHFKSHDPEYGLVKEEIINDDDTLPGIDGKIIAWVEEDLD